MTTNRSWKVHLRDVLVIAVVAVGASVLIRTYVARSFFIPSASMENTLLINDRVIVSELQPRPFPLRRGDVVVFRDPGGWLGSDGPAGQGQLNLFEAGLSLVGFPSPKEEGHLIKRAIGLPGDKVVCCDASGRVTVNGVALNEAPYLHSPDEPASATPFDVTVPAGSLWVMGDNRNNSADSRLHMSDPGRGFVPESDVVGRAMAVTWPIGRWAWLDDYPLVFARVPEPSGKRD